MRALVCHRYGPADQLTVEERPDPEPAADEVLVDIRAAGLNFPDFLNIQGLYQVKTPPPFIPGSEAAGVVAAVGSAVTRFRPGDAVMVLPQLGAFAEKCVAREAFANPSRWPTFEQAAGFAITYATSYHALKQSASLAAGETLLVLGAAGGVGITAVEIGKAMGARVIAAASSGEKLAFASTAGADELIDYRTGLKDSAPADRWQRRRRGVRSRGRRTCAAGAPLAGLARPLPGGGFCRR
jgi:NADPH2:quinone reductase